LNVPAYHEIAQALLQALGPGEKGALAGGVAVGAYGYVRATRDVDIVVGIPLSEAQRRLASKGIETVLKPGDSLEGDFSCLRGSLGGVPFDVIPALVEVAWERTIALPIGSAIVRVVDLAALIALKLRAGGPQDLLDVAMLVLLHPEHEPFARQHAAARGLQDRLAAYLTDPRLRAQAAELGSG
jgi:hypothetical protein